MTDYIVDTTCGRHFCWSATSYENLILSLQDRGYMQTFIMPYEEYQRMEDAKTHIERELKESA